MAAINSDSKFNIYRCPDPRKVVTTSPWYRIDDFCPCDPTQSNVSGRGYTPCTFGMQVEMPNPSELQPPAFGLQLPGQLVSSVNNFMVGSMYQNDQIVPPQLQPRPLTRIGQSWLSGN